MLMAFYNCRITHTLLDSTFITDEISDICSTTNFQGEFSFSTSQDQHFSTVDHMCLISLLLVMIFLFCYFSLTPLYKIHVV